MDSSIGPVLRVAFASTWLHREVVGRVRVAVRAWLESYDGVDLAAFEAGMCDVGADLMVLCDDGLSPGGVLTHRWRIRRAARGGLELTVVISTVELGETWVLVECRGLGTGTDGVCDTARDGAQRHGEPGAFVRGLLERVEAYDGAARLTLLPQTVLDATGATELAEVIRDPRRRLPVVVMAEAVTVRRAAWEAAVVRLAHTAAGAASMFVLMPQALRTFSRLTGGDVARACGDDAALVYLPRVGARHAGSRLLPDGELHLCGDSQDAPDGCLPVECDGGDGTNLFTPQGLRVAGSRTRLPEHLVGIPSLLYSGREGDANFDDIGVVRLLLGEADSRAHVAEQRAAALELRLATLERRLTRN
ncbi:hypothetical protein GCM10023205_53130 [Yinghuangia aomiensis]|uniref:Uncharacterized protein n=1 Tax=Yinghuangia aomiensis TaxID=676205 RepID=A0ABP9HUQ9_9ACTN